MLAFPAMAGAETLRIATWDIEMARKAPGLMLRDILKGDAQAESVAKVVSQVRPDVLFLQGVDYDAQLQGARALAKLFEQDYPHILALPPNAGLASGLDLNGDGRRGRAADAQGWGRFFGEGAMVLLSRWPIITAEVRNFTALRWRDLPGAVLPQVDGLPFPSEEAQAVQRLSSVGHWVVPVETPAGRLTLMLFAAGPPVFDGPEDRNGLRNADEIRLWQVLLDGGLGEVPQPPLVILGNANLDPDRGDGRREVIRTLLDDPRLQDPHAGMGPTVDWTDPRPGDMRVDYVLPSRDLAVGDAGVVWPREDAQGLAVVEQASRHRMVWVDLAF